MVLDAAMVVSLMVNGLCCAWQEQNEKERREVFRNDIRDECRRSRILEAKIHEQRQKKLSLAAGLENYSSFIAEESIRRRQKLMSDKKKALESPNNSVSSMNDKISVSSAPPHYKTPSYDTITSNSRRRSYYCPRTETEQYQALMNLANKGSLIDLDDDDDDDIHDEDSSMVSIPLSSMSSFIHPEVETKRQK